MDEQTPLYNRLLSSPIAQQANTSSALFRTILDIVHQCEVRGGGADPVSVLGKVLGRVCAARQEWLDLAVRRLAETPEDAQGNKRGLRESPVPLSADAVERAFELQVVYRESKSGVTERSKEAFLSFRHRIGPVRVVYLVYVTEPSWDFLTYLVDRENRTLCFDGFAWGYVGEGSRGLAWLFAQLGFQLRDPLPDAHTSSCWAVLPHGHVFQMR